MKTMDAKRIGERIPRDNIKIRLSEYYSQPITVIFLVKNNTKRECGKGGEGEMSKDEIQQTMQLINENIKKKINQSRDNGKEIYLLALALKELNQLEPK